MAESNKYRTVAYDPSFEDSTTGVYPFRMERGEQGFLATRWFFRVEGDDKATFVAVEPIPEDEQSASA